MKAAPAPGSGLFRKAGRGLRGEAAEASSEPVYEQIEILMLTGAEPGGRAQAGHIFGACRAPFA